MNYQEIITSLFPLVNFGLVVLIWIVQLIVYPSFLFYKRENLMLWHNTYTRRIAIVVVPLMLLQLIISITNCLFGFNMINLLILLIAAFLWVFTFTSFAPIHFKISENNFETEQLNQLVTRNWIRTILWTILFILGII
ncbi:putative membrane protein [Polaribacter sp. MED152]|nr:putative membrane protein [Polaribacter sp. MED152]